MEDSRRSCLGQVLVVLCVVLGTAHRAPAAPQPPRVADLNGRVAALVIYAGDLVAGGDFTSTASAPVNYLARWDGTAWVPLGPDLDGPVAALTLLGQDLLVGGLFENAGSLAAAHLALWDGDHWSALGAGTNGPVYALATQAGVVVYVAGAFTEAGGFRARSVARYVLGNWSPLGGGVIGNVRALAVFNGSLVAGGDFTLGGANLYEHNLARFSNGSWHNIAFGVDGIVMALVVYNGSLVAGGNFQRIDFITPARHVARLTGDTWDAMGVGIGPVDSLDVSEVRAFAVQGNDLIAGGDFVMADLQPVANVARWGGTGWGPIGTGIDGVVEALAPQGDLIYAGGDFTQAGGVGVGRVAFYREHDRDWLPISAVAIAATDFSARWQPTGAVLHWTLATDVVGRLRGVEIERTRVGETRWVSRTPVWLDPEPRMQWSERGGEAGSFDYRLVLHGIDATRTFVGPVSVTGVAPGTALLAPRAAADGSDIVIPFTLAAATPVRLQVFDVRGTLQRTLLSEALPAGSHVSAWDRTNTAGFRVARGVYWVRLLAGEARASRSLIVTHP